MSGSCSILDACAGSGGRSGVAGRRSTRRRGGERGEDGCGAAGRRGEEECGGERGEDEWVVRERRVGYTASGAFWAQNSSEMRVALNASLCQKHNAKKIVWRGIIEPATSHTGTTILYHCTTQENLL